LRLGACTAVFAGCAFGARYSAQRRLVASAIRLRPAALILRVLPAGCSPAFTAAHRFRWAAAMRLRPAALVTRLTVVGCAAVAFPPRVLRISASI
jgi:hypothetical protein